MILENTKYTNYQRIKTNTNLATKSLFYTDNMPERCCCNSGSKVVGLINDYLIEFKDHSLRWNTSLALSGGQELETS